MMNGPLASIFTGGNASAPMIPAQSPVATGGNDPLAVFAQMLLGGGGEGGLMAPSGDTLRPSWQQELMKNIDPEEEANRNRRKALLAASQAMMSTPGNAMQGLAQAAGTGAQQWQTGQDQIGDRRMETLKLLFDDQAQQKAAEFQGLKARLDMQHGIKADQRADRTTDSLISYREGRVDAARRRAEQDARKIDLKIGGTGSGLNYAQRRMANDSVIKAVSDFRETVLSRAFTEEDRMVAEQQVMEYENRLYARYGLDPDTGNFPQEEGREKEPAPGIIPPDPNALRLTPGAPGKTDFGGGLSSAQSTGTADMPFTPQSIADLDAVPQGAIYLNPADGRPYRKN